MLRCKIQKAFDIIVVRFVKRLRVEIQCEIHMNSLTSLDEANQKAFEVGKYVCPLIFFARPSHINVSLCILDSILRSIGNLSYMVTKGLNPNPNSYLHV